MSVYNNLEDQDLREFMPEYEQRGIDELIDTTLYEFTPKTLEAVHLENLHLHWFDTAMAMAREILELRIYVYQEGSGWEYDEPEPFTEPKNYQTTNLVGWGSAMRLTKKDHK